MEERRDMTDDLHLQFKYFTVFLKELLQALVARGSLKGDDVDYILSQALKVLEDDNVNKQK